MLVVADQLVNQLIVDVGIPFRMRITGYPACGKTTISRLICQNLLNVKHLEAETWIYTLASRKAQNISGSHPDAYDVSRSVFQIQSFLQGHELQLRMYDHKVGDHTTTWMVQSEPNMSVILDGSIFSVSDFDDLVPTCLFLEPFSKEEWLSASIERDVKTRHFTKSEAVRHNMRKAEDMEKIENRSSVGAFIRYRVHHPTYMYELAS